MAAVTQPGSRAGLITTLVIFVILFMIAGAMALVKSSEEKAAVQRLADYEKKMKPVIKETEIPAAKQFAADAQEGTNDPRTFYEHVLKQRSDLAAAVTGFPDKSTKQALEDEKATREAIKPRLSALRVEISNNSLLVALTQLTDALEKRDAAAKADVAGKVEAAKKELDDRIKAFQDEVTKAKGEVDKAKAEIEKAKADVEVFRKEKNDQIDKMAAEQSAQIKKLNDDIAALNTQISSKGAEILVLQKENKRLVEMYMKWRPRDLATSSMRRADGKIIQVNKDTSCYINLGQGQQISRGMTFEVYDKKDGMPKGPGETETDLPRGKASIEVVNIGPGSSECHVVRLSPGEQLMEGDIIANLIYDPNVSWTFKVYGDFDIDQDGRCTPAEAEIIKRLIVAWGGKVTDKVDMDTDFIIMGREPTMPVFSKEELEDPIKKLDKAKADAATKAYNDVRDKALEMHIPVLNQNRFLYMIGFYDQAKK